MLHVEEDDLDENDDEVVHVEMKDESDEDEATALVTYVKKITNGSLTVGVYIT